MRISDWSSDVCSSDLQKLRANAMGQIGGAAGVEDGAEDIGDVCEGDQLVALGEHGGHDVEVDAAILGQRNYVDFCASALGDELPGDDVAVFLQQDRKSGV